LCFLELRSSFSIVAKEWDCSSVYAASQVFRYRNIDWSHAEGVRMNLQKIFIKFEELVEMQSEVISVLQGHLVQSYDSDAKNDPVEQVEQVEQVLHGLLLEDHHVLGDMSLKERMISILNKYRVYVDSISDKMGYYANNLQ